MHRPVHHSTHGAATIGTAVPLVPLAPFSFEDLLERVRAEFLEQPGLCLTEAQAARLWHLDNPTCTRVLATLTDGAFLRRGVDGRYLRR
jgi:hypothetical protein